MSEKEKPWFARYYIFTLLIVAGIIEGLVTGKIEWMPSVLGMYIFYWIFIK